MTQITTDIFARREPLTWTSNPENRVEYLVTLSGRIRPAGLDCLARILIRYIPHRAVLETTAFESYLNAVAGFDWQRLEDVAVGVLDDFNNEIVPCWVRVEIEAFSPDNEDTPSSTGVMDNYKVVIEDRQPNWDNPVLLSRL